jgi:DNA-binding SARP family transcriptional activator
MTGVTGDGALIRVQLLGTVRAWRGGLELRLGPPQQQLVLAVLAMQAGTTVCRDDLVDAVWERAADSAVNSVHKYVHGLRSAMDPGRAGRSAGPLASVAGGYELRLAPGSVDAGAFAARREAARRARAAGDLAGAAQYLASGLGLWRGSALSGLSGPWAQAQRRRLAEAHLAAVEERIEVQLARGYHAEQAAELAGLVSMHPLREGLWYQLMLARYRCGQRAQALAAYQDARDTLIDQLGVEPGARLRQLHRQILNADPELDPPREPGRAMPAAGAASRPTRPPRHACRNRRRGSTVWPGAGHGARCQDTPNS